jgi:hypothetical protein
MDTAEIERIRPLVADLVRIGFFRLSGISTTLSLPELAQIAAEESDFHVIALEDGWYVTNSEETLATETLNRIAGVVYESVVVGDVVGSLMRAILCGPSWVDERNRRKRGRVLNEVYESSPSRAVLTYLSDIVGARMESFNGVDRIDFSDVTYPVSPSQKEQAIIYALEESPYGAMQVSRLCRRVGISRASTYHRIDSMPYILKDHRKAARLIGADGHPEGYIPADMRPFFLGLRWSRCGSRALVHLSANEECIESNSCNIPADARSQIEGSYVEVCSGNVLECEHREGRDNRKISGFTETVHALCEDYVSKDNIYLILDKQTGEARLDVLSMHASGKMAAIERMLEEGIIRGQLPDKECVGMAA